MPAVTPRVPGALRQNLTLALLALTGEASSLAALSRSLLASWAVVAGSGVSQCCPFHFAEAWPW